MQKRRLANNIDVSVVGLGTVKFGRNQGVKYPTAFELPSDKEVIHLLETARELGINFLDTAPAYGLSEERLGKLLIGQRKDWIIASKAGEEFIAGQSQFDFTASALAASVERSLRLLKTDYLDVLLIHSDGNDERIINEDAVFITLEKLQNAGKIRAYGMSTKTVAGGKLTLQYADIAMVTHNPSYTDEREVLEYAKQVNKGILIKKAFASGHLQKIGSPSNALNFILNEPGVTSVIVGTVNPNHLRENIAKLSDPAALK